MDSLKWLEEFTPEDIEQVLKYQKLLKVDHKLVHSQEVRLWVNEMSNKYSVEAMNKVATKYPVK